MKLRNKKTGEIIDLSEGFIKDTYNGEFIQIKPVAISNKEGYLYDSLSKLNEEWEDYKPAEPLIKDGKIRKAVRAWAKLNRLEKVEVEPPTIDCAIISFSWGMLRIDFYLGRSDISDGEYTIDELCGEEEQ